MTRRSQRHRSSSLPFAYRNSGLDFELEAYSIDGKKPVDLDLLAGQRDIDLVPSLQPDDSDGPPEWEKIVLYGNLDVPRDTIDDVFPEDEREDLPAKLYVTLRCHETIYRDRKMLADPVSEPGEHDVTIVLYKEDIRGTVELRPYLVRTKDRSGDGKYATKKNFRVASGDIYRAVVDRPPGEQPPAIDGEEISFSQAAHLPGGDKLYYLDFRNQARPKLWLNSDHPRITDILQSRGSVGAEARMRDVILDQISYGIWTQLLLRAGSALDDDGEVEYEWQDTVLETFARNLYGVDDLTEAKHELRSDLEETDSIPHLMELIDRELQEYIDPRTQLINLMEEGLRI